MWLKREGHVYAKTHKEMLLYLHSKLTKHCVTSINLCMSVMRITNVSLASLRPLSEPWETVGDTGHTSTIFDARHQW